MSKYQTKSGGKFYKTDEFIKLNEKWKKKLEKSGFVDAEQDEDHMKQWDSFNFSGRYNAELFNSKQKYYQLAGQFSYDHKFKNKRDKLIWELHSNGYTVRAIAAEIKKRNFKYNKVMTIFYIIRRLEREMLEKYAKEDD